MHSRFFPSAAARKKYFARQTVWAIYGADNYVTIAWWWLPSGAIEKGIRWKSVTLGRRCEQGPRPHNATVRIDEWEGATEGGSASQKTCQAMNNPGI